ncbi:MAG: hypothetical protein ACK5CG_06155 [Aphanizomenon sp.]
MVDCEILSTKTMQLKRWESPRQEGRNDKGRGGSARKRQLKKQRQMLRKKLKENQQPNDHHNNNWGKVQLSPIFWPFLPTNLSIIAHVGFYASTHPTNQGFFQFRQGILNRELYLCH